MSGDLGKTDENIAYLCWGTNDNDAKHIGDNIVGRVISAGSGENLKEKDEDTDGGDNDDGDDDGQEPLALLVIHAAMHMLFLPQFTCEFEEDNDDLDVQDDSVSAASSITESTRGTDYKNKTKEENFTHEERNARKLDQNGEEDEEDFFIKKETGLKPTRYVDSGISLLPRPATIVWAGGIGLKPNKVIISNIFPCFFFAD